MNKLTKLTIHEQNNTDYGKKNCSQTNKTSKIK